MSDDQDGCEWVNVSSGTDLKVKSKKSKVEYSSSQTPHRYGNSRAIWDHTVLPATRQR